MKRFLKGFANTILNAFGIQISEKGRRISMTDIVDQFLALGFRPKTVIDVGVADGTFELYRFPNAKYLLIEPLKEFENNLQSISRRYHGEYVLAAASDSPGTITINVHEKKSGSSIFLETEGSFLDGVPREVTAVTIDDLCKVRKLGGPYLIKADVQGAELKVLDGARKVLNDTEVVIIEASLFQFYKKGPQLYDVVTYMKKRGFVIYDFCGGHNRPLNGALAQLDVIFVRETGQFRKHHSYRSFMNPRIDDQVQRA